MLFIQLTQLSQLFDIDRIKVDAYDDQPQMILGTYILQITNIVEILI